MQEYINGKILINDRLVRKNFLIKDKKVFLKYKKENYKTINLKGLIVAPGFVDIHVHTRVPGFEYKEDVQHIIAAALAGGVTTFVAMANTNPEPFDIKSWKYVNAHFKNQKVKVIQAAKVTHKDKVVDIHALTKYTKIFSDDGLPISNSKLMVRALKIAKKNNAILFLHEQDINIKGHAYESAFTRKYKISAFDDDFEYNMIQRDIDLNKKINAQIHLQHISTKQGLDLYRVAKKEGMKITAELTPHHVFFNNENIKKDDGTFKVSPPLTNRKNQIALQRAFTKGEINIIATDHAPHTINEKNISFVKSANGVIGMEIAFAAFNTIFPKHLEKILMAYSINPAKLIGEDVSIKDGCKLNLIIIDPNKKWIVKKQDFKSKALNSPFIGQKLVGKVVDVLVA